MSKIESKTLASISHADRTAMWLSVLCMAHCLLTPVLILIFPALHLSHEHNTFHWIMALTLLILTWVAFYRGFRIHRRKASLGAAMTGVVLLFLALLDSNPHNTWTAPGTVLTVAGSVLLIAAHVVNIRHCRSCSCPSHS